MLERDAVEPGHPTGRARGPALGARPRSGERPVRRRTVSPRRPWHVCCGCAAGRHLSPGISAARPRRTPAVPARPGHRTVRAVPRRRRVAGACGTGPPAHRDRRAQLRFVGAAVQGLSYVDDERPHQLASYEEWDGPVVPETITATAPSLTRAASGRWHRGGRSPADRAACRGRPRPRRDRARHRSRGTTDTGAAPASPTTSSARMTSFW